MLTELEFNNNRALKSRFNGYGDYVDQINEMDTTQDGNKFNFMDYLPFGDKSISGSIMKGIANLGGKSYQQFDPRGNTKGGVYTMDGVNYADPSQVNESYDNDRSSPTYGTNRFDRAKSGSFASYRTLKDFFDTKKDTAPKTTTTTAPTNNDNDNGNQSGGGDFRNADGSNVNQDFSTTASVSNYDPSVLYADGGRAGYFFGGRARLQGGGGADMGAPEKAAERASKGYGTAPDTGSKSGTNDYSSFEQNVNHQRAMRDNQKEKPSTLDNVMNLGSELSYLNNLKNLNVPGIALNFGVNKFRNYMKNKNLKEEDKFSYNSTLPTTGTFTAANGGRAMFKNGGLASIL